MASSQLIFSSRIVSVDSYMTEPVAGLDLERSDFHKTAIHSVPVVRVFGSTPAGQTTCLHIHGVFPYLMVPYNGPDVTESHWSEIDVYTHVIAAGLDNALNTASGKSKSTRQHVFKIVLLRGIPFYGYHEEEELFLKIYFYFPGDVKRAADLLQNGAVLDRSFQVHEAHIPYILQLFLDYNLYGMNLLHTRNCWFRLPIGKPDMISELPVIPRPGDIAPNANKSVNKKSSECQRKGEQDTGRDFRAPTTSQLRNFDWNMLRDANLRQGSQNAELDCEEEYLNLSGNKSEITSASESTRGSRRSAQGDSCSDLCSSVLSRTVTQDSTLLNSSERKLCPLHTLWTCDVVPDFAKLPGSVSRHSTCDIEVDVLAADIANRYELLGATASNPGIEAIWEDEKSRRRKRDEDSQIVMEQSQPRVIPANLSEREARYLQMLYDSLDRYKEENGVHSFNDSLSFTTPSTGTKLSPDSFQSRRESVDFIASPSDAASDDCLALSGGSTLPAGSQGMKSSGSSRAKWSQSNVASMVSEEDISTLELLRRMEERDALDNSVATQHGNGPLDEDHERLDLEECEQSHNRTMRRLSQSFHDSPRIDAFSDDTRPLPLPSDDEEAIESFEMSQRWDSAIRDLLDDLSASEIGDFSDSEDAALPQLDGTSDDLPESSIVIVSKTEKRVPVVPAEQHLSSKASTVEADPVNGDDLVGKRGSHGCCTRSSHTNVAHNGDVSADAKSCTKIVVDCKKLETDTQCHISSQNTSFDTLLKDENAKSNETSANEKTVKITNCKDENLPSTEIIEPALKQARPRGQAGQTTDAPADKPDVVLTKRQGGARTNVFKQILNENPGVTLYDNERLCKFTRTAVINLDQMPAPDARRTYPVSTLDGNLIKITSVPVFGLDADKKTSGEVAPATKSRRVRKKNDDHPQKEACQQTRTRRPRLASKNSYLEDPLYETVFDSDFESDCDDANAVGARSSAPRPNGAKNKLRKTKEPKRKKKQRAVTKWIIVNRFKGVSSMRVGLWRIPNAKQVKLTTEGLRMYELYSPRSADIVAKPVRPPFVPPPKKPRPMGRRSKHMLASLCPFGPRNAASNAADAGSNGTAAVGENTDFLNSNSRAPDAVSPLAPNAEPEIVKSDAPILEKMAFDLLRHEEALSERVSDREPQSMVEGDKVLTIIREGADVRSERNKETALFASLKGSCTGVSNAIVAKQKPSADEEVAVVSAAIDATSLTSCVRNNTSSEAEKMICATTENGNSPLIESGVHRDVASDLLQNRVVSSKQAEHSVSALRLSSDVAACGKSPGNTDEAQLNCRQRDRVSDKTSRKKAVRSKKEARKRKLATKAERSSLTPRDNGREAKVTKSIVPVASRTVQPICRIASADSDAGGCTIDLVGSRDCGAAKSAGSTQGGDGDTVTAKDKKAVSASTPSRRIYSPSKKVTRNSVAVKLNSIHRPRTMFTAASDDSREPFPPMNALMSIAYPPSPGPCPKAVAEPPRPWSPVTTRGAEAPGQETEKDFFGELAESLGADASKMFDLVDDSLFKNMGGIEQLIADQPADGQKEERRETAADSTRDKNETMLQHFDKVFEDVTSNGPSKAFRAGASANLDQFEKETLMEFIDEMTSTTPNQPGDNNPPQAIAYPVPAPTPMDLPQNTAAAPKKQAPPKNQVPPGRRVKATPFPNAPFVNENWVMPTTHDRPQSCYPGQISRPGTAGNQWQKDAMPPALYDDARMKEIQNNLSTPKPYGFNAGNHCFEPQNKANRSYFTGPGTQSQCAPPQPSYPYAFNQYYRDPGPIPRPNTVLDTPLQVFHTHVHHHHHVHSINNSEARGVRGGEAERPYYDAGAVKRESGACDVKMEKIPNPTWPKTATPAAPKAKSKPKKTQFYVSNSPFPFPKAAAQVCVQSQGLVQTLTYVDTAVARDRAGSKSGFYKFTGLDAKSQGGVQPVVPRCRRQNAAPLFSVLLKGACQTSPRLGYRGKEFVGKPKNRQKSKNLKKKTKYKPAIPIFPNKQSDAQLPSAKTPYGIMKQNALNSAKKHDFTPKSGERKRKPICDFDAPPDTPTISLSGWSSSSGPRKNAEPFELSQDMYDSTKPCETRVKTSAPPEMTDARPGGVTPPANRRSPDPRPTPRAGEELILNSATGEWEVVPAEPQKSDDEGGAGKLAGQSPARKRAHGQTPDVSSDDDGADVAVKTKCLKPGRVKIAFSTPEYMVSSVDLKSDSPRLKLTLKKAPSCRGKPQIAALSPADRGASENFEAKTADELKPLKIVRKKSGPEASAGADVAQFRIYDSDATEDASETDDVVDEPSATVTMGAAQTRGALATSICGQGAAKETALADASSDRSCRFSAGFAESRAEAGEVASKVLLECCDRVADEATESESQHPNVSDRAGSHKSCSGGDPKNGEAPKGRKSAAKSTRSSNVKDPQTARTTNPGDSTGPPSPPKDQCNTRTSRTIPATNFYTTSNKPPSPAVVMRDLVSAGQASHLLSDEPFYGNAADAGAASNRLSNLPPYVKRPKPRKAPSDLPEHASSLPMEGGIRHWIVMATAGQSYDESDTSAMRRKASAILPENVHVWDHLDAASKLSQYPRLSEVFLEGGDVLLRPARLPPTWRDVKEWLDGKKKTRADEKLRLESDQVESSPDNNGRDLPVKISKPSLRRSLSFTSPLTSTGRPRRVSFDVADLGRCQKSRDSDRLKPIEGSPVKKFEKAFKTAPKSDSDVLFSAALSPVASDPKMIGESPSTSERRVSSAGEARSREGSIKTRPQSTPSESKRAHKRSSYAPPGAVSPVSETSPRTPLLKKAELRKVLLSKKFSNAGEGERSYRSNSLSLSTPSQGSERGSQVDGPTLDNTYGFKGLRQHLGEAKSLHVVQHITAVSVELHVKTRIDLRPDPDMDEIRCLFYCLDSDSWTGSETGMRTGAIVVDPASASESGGAALNAPSASSAPDFVARERELFKKSGITSLDVRYVSNETELFLLFAQFMHRWDPDILVGYEVQMLSWGFLLQRAAHLRCDLCRAISRIPSDEQRNRHTADGDAYGADNASELHIVGRVVLNLWRLMRTELALYDYSFESVAFHMLHERHPRYDHRTLTNWFDPPSRSGLENHRHRYRVIDYYVSRVRGNMRLLAQQDFVGRTSELARLFGIQFYEVLTRGSQFRVESMLLRTARARNMVSVTPSVLQRAQMRAPEVIALVMEPESRFYRVPVVVVDFQSLYPSVVIAHNICYSTCLGRVESLGSDEVFTFGCTSLRIPAKTLRKLLRKNMISINPSGVAFVKPKVRKGVMPRMLDEILTTRIMVKDSMKRLGPDEAATKRMLDHRQIGLKYIANFTYGYTAANFSGRMPCVEIGDSIVHKARETLERAVRLVTANSSKWEHARVVYGDTDSMFIALDGLNETGCSKARAFEVGREITAAVTADNPTPVKLKFEKVYLPCVLETKKRYVGYAYESEEQREPMFDAKGIETVRRDGTPATAKILEKTLKILFDSRDVSKVKEYVSGQCTKLLDGRTTLQDCVIAKEYRGKQYYKPGAVVPALNIARKMLALDRRAEPRVGERVPYVIVHGPPATPLYQLVRSPLDVLRDPSLQLNGAYYVTKHVLPALDRVFSLLGVDVFLWYRHLPRTVHLSRDAAPQDSQCAAAKKATISQFFQSKHCLACKSLSVGRVCADCLNGGQARQRTAIGLASEASSLERRKHDIERVCMHCTGAQSASEIRCVSLDCSILYKSFRAAYSCTKVKSLRKSLRDHDLL